MHLVKDGQSIKISSLGNGDPQGHHFLEDIPRGIHIMTIGGVPPPINKPWFINPELTLFMCVDEIPIFFFGPVKNLQLRQRSWMIRDIRDMINLYPIGSMYGIYTNIGGILMVNVTIYSIHGSYGIWFCRNQRTYQLGWSSASVSKFMTPNLGKRGVVDLPPKWFEWLRVMLSIPPQTRKIRTCMAIMDDITHISIPKMLVIGYTPWWTNIAMENGHWNSGFSQL